MNNKSVSYKSTTMACYIGYFAQAIVINLAPILFIPLREQFGLSYSQLGSLIFINFVTQLIVDIAFSKSVDKHGFRLFAISGHILCAIGLATFAILPNVLSSNSYLALLIGTLIFSAGGGLLELLISPIIDAIPTDDKATAMSLLHSFYAWGQVTFIIVTTIFLFIFGKDKWPIIVLVWAMVPLVNSFIFSKVPLAQKLHESQVMKVRALIKNPIFIIAFFSIMLGAASEVTMNQWASTFMEKGLMLPKVIGDTAGMCMFAVMLGIGRAIYGVYGSRFNVNKVMIYGSMGAVVCYVVVALSPYNSLSIIACAMCGIFVSLLWPGTLVVASEKLPLAGASMFALLAAAGDLGAAAGPAITGAITDFASSNIAPAFTTLNMAPEQLGLRIGLIIAAIFPVLATISFTILMKYRSKKLTDRIEEKTIIS